MANPIYVNSEWSGCSVGDLVFIGDNMYTFGTDAFADIQSAVNAAETDGAEINVLAGTYAGNVTLTHAAVGENKTNMTIKAYNNDDVNVTGVFQVGAQDNFNGWQGGLTIEGIDFDSTNNHSLQMTYAYDVTVKDCSFNGAVGNYMVNITSNASGSGNIFFEDCDFGTGYIQIYRANLRDGRGVEFTDCDFDESTVNVPGGQDVKFNDCDFTKTLSDYHAAHSFYIIRSNDTAITINGGTLNVDSTASASTVPEEAGDWAILWQRNAGTTVWNVDGVEVNYTSAAAAVEDLLFSENATTTAANAPSRVTFENLTAGASSAADVDALLANTSGYAIVETATGATIYNDGAKKASTSDSNLYADGSWAGSKIGTEVAEGKYFGINAFSSIDDARKVIKPGVETTINLSGNLDATANFNFGQNVVLTGTAALNWKSGWFFVGRGGSGTDRDALTTVTVKDANISSINPSTGASSTGFHVSSYTGSDNKNYGKLVIENSTITCDDLINRNLVDIIGSDATFVNMYIHGRNAGESKSGTNETAYLNISDGSTVTLVKSNGLHLGAESYGVINVSDTSSFIHEDTGWTIAAMGIVNLTDEATFTATNTAITNNGAITLTAGNTFTAKSISGTGTITIDAAALDANTTKKVIDLSQTAELANVALTDESIAAGVRLLKGADGDVVVTNVSADNVYVNSEWAGSAAGAVVGEGKYYGINAFDKVATAYAALSSGGTIHLEDGTSTYELGTKIQIKDGKGFTITGNAAPVDIRTVSMDEDTGDLYVISTDSKKNTKTVLFSGTVIPIFTLGGKDDEPDFANIPDSTMNVTNAQFGIAELDARPNGTVNVTNSTLTDHGGNSIIKSYFNGAINVTSSNLEAMQVTTTGYITLNDGAILLDTWQTNLYDNGIITLNAGATFYTSKMTIGHTYNRVNPDAARVGKPATLDVNGGTLEGLPTTHAYHYNTTDFFVGKDAAGLFLIRNGGTATLTHGSGLQIMAQGTMSLTNGTLTVLTVTGSGSNEYAGKIRNAGTITLDVDSSITATELINSGDGSITVDATAALAANTVKKVIDLSQTASLKDLVTVNLGTSGSKVAYGADGDVVIHNISVDNVYVNSDWATGYSVGDEVTIGEGASAVTAYYGISAFDNFKSALAVAQENGGATISFDDMGYTYAAPQTADAYAATVSVPGTYIITGGNGALLNYELELNVAKDHKNDYGLTVEDAFITLTKLTTRYNTDVTIKDSRVDFNQFQGGSAYLSIYNGSALTISNSTVGFDPHQSGVQSPDDLPDAGTGAGKYWNWAPRVVVYGKTRITDSKMYIYVGQGNQTGFDVLGNSDTVVTNSTVSLAQLNVGNTSSELSASRLAQGESMDDLSASLVIDGSTFKNTQYRGDSTTKNGIIVGSATNTAVKGTMTVKNNSLVDFTVLTYGDAREVGLQVNNSGSSVVITSGSTVKVPKITNAGTITIDATSLLTGSTYTGAGSSITVDATGFAGGVKKVIDLSLDAALSDVNLINVGETGARLVKGADGDVVVTNVSVDTAFVNSAWATGYSLGDEITLADSTKVYYGINAFSNIDSLFALYGDKDHRNTETTEVVFLSDVTATATGKQFFFSDVDVAFTAESDVMVDMRSYTRAYLMGYYEVTNFSGQPTSVPTFTIGDNVTFVAKTLMAGQAIDNPDDVDAQGDATRAPGAANVIVNGTIEAGQTYAAAFSNISTGMSGVITTAGVNDNEMVIRSQSTITVTGDGNHTKTQFSPQWVSNQGGTLTLKDTVGDTGTVKTLDNVKDLYPGNSLITVDNTNLTTYALDLQDVQGELQLVNGSALANSTSASNAGAITVDATSAITTAGAFANHGAINITVGGTVTAKSFTNDGTITIDVTGISGSAADVITVTSETGSAIDKDGVTLIGTDADKFAVILKDNGGVSVARVGEDVYIWNGCAGLATGTPVTVNGTEAFVGIDAFATLDKALTTVGKTIYFKSNDAPALAITGHLNGSSLLKASDAEADVTVAMGSSVSAANNMLTGDLTIGEGVTFAATKLVHRNTAEKTTITVEGTFQSDTNAYLYAGVMDVAETGKLTGDDVFLNGSGGTYELNVNGNDNKPEQVDVTSLRIGASATANFTDTIVSADSLSVTAATGVVNASNTTINGDVTNAGTFNADEATINGKVSNAGTINLAAGSTLVSDTITNTNAINGNSGAIEADSIINGASDGSVKGTITAATLNASSIVNNNGAAKKGGSSIELTGDLVAGDIVNGVEPIVPGTDEPKDKALIKAANITADSITNFGTVGSQTSELEHTLGTIELVGGLDNGLYGNVMADNLNAASLDNHNEVLVNNITIGGVINNYAGAAIALNNGEGSTGHIVINAVSVSNAGYIKTLSGGSIKVTGNLFNDTYAELTDDEKLNKVALEKGLIETDSIEAGTVTNNGKIDVKVSMGIEGSVTNNASGTINVAGALDADSVSNAGTINVAGTLDAAAVENNGTVNVAGKLTSTAAITGAGTIVVTGSGDLDSDVVLSDGGKVVFGTKEAAANTTFSKSITDGDPLPNPVTYRHAAVQVMNGKVTIDGTVRIQGDAGANRFIVGFRDGVTAEELADINASVTVTGSVTAYNGSWIGADNAFDESCFDEKFVLTVDGGDFTNNCNGFTVRASGAVYVKNSGTFNISDASVRGNISVTESSTMTFGSGNFYGENDRTAQLKIDDSELAVNTKMILGKAGVSNRMGALVLDNGAQVTGNGEFILNEGGSISSTASTIEITSTITNSGAIALDAASSLTAAGIDNTGTVTIDATGFVGTKRVIDLSQTTSLEGSVTVNGLAEGMNVFYGADGDVVLSDASKENLYVSDSAAWAGKSFGDVVTLDTPEGTLTLVYGVNAFRTSAEMRAALAEETTNVYFTVGNTASYGDLGIEQNVTVSTIGDGEALLTKFDINDKTAPVHTVTVAEGSKFRFNFDGTNALSRMAKLVVDGTLTFDWDSRANYPKSEIVVGKTGSLIFENNSVNVINDYAEDVGENKSLTVYGTMRIGTQGEYAGFYPKVAGSEDHGGTTIIDGKDGAGVLTVYAPAFTVACGYASEFKDTGKFGILTLKNGGKLISDAVKFYNGTEGVITLTDASTFTVTPSEASVSDTYPSGNAGTIDIQSGSKLSFGSMAGFVNAGTISVSGSGSEFAINTLTNNGTIALGDGATFTGDVVSTGKIEVTGTVTVTGAITNDATGAITIDAASSLLSATSIANEGTITIDTTGFTGMKKIIDLDGVNQTITGEGTIEVDGARLVYHGEDSSYYLTNVDQSVLYVSNAWSTASYGDEVETGKFYGINAFSALQGAKGALAVAMPRTADTTITFEGTSFSEAYDDDIMANFSGNVVFNGSPVTLNQTTPDARMDLCVSPAAGTTATIRTPITAASSDSLAGIWLNFTGEGTTKVSSTITAKTYIGINSKVDVDKDATLTTEADLQIGRAKDAIATDATITGTDRTFGTDEYQISAQGIQLNEGTATVTGSKVKANTLSVTDTFAFNADTGAYTGAVTLNSTKTTWDLASIIVGFYTAEAIGGYLTPGASTFNFTDSVINVGAIKNQAYFIPGADGQIDETKAIEGYALTINLDGTTLEAASILNNGTIALTDSSTATVTGAITGTGTITVDASTLSFGGDFAAGTLTLSNGGTVAAISGNRELTIGTLTGTITVNADANLTGSVVGGTGDIAVSGDATLTLDGKTDVTSFGAVTNAGTIDIDGKLVNLGAIDNSGAINMDWHDMLTFTGFSGSAINFDMSGFNGIEEDTKVLDFEGTGTKTAADYQAMLGFDADYLNRYFVVTGNDLYLKGGVSDTVYVHDGMSIADAVGQAIEQSAIRIVVEDGTFSAPADFGPVITKYSPYYDFTDNMFTGYEVVINDGTFDDSATRITGGAVIELTGKRQYVITGGDRSVTINGGEFNGVVVGGDRLTTVGNLTHGNNDPEEEVEVFNASLSLEINGGVFNKNVAGGMMLDIKSDDASVDQYGDINLTINGGTFVKFIYGGNVSSNRGFSSHITVTGDITVTIDTTACETISINSLYAGSFGDGKVNGSTKVVLTGDGQYLSVADQLWGGCTSDVYIVNSDGTKTANSKVTGTRTLSFEGFTGDLNVKSIKMFSDVKFDADSDVNFANFGGTLAEVENWEIAFGSKITGAFNNNFAGDSLNLTGLTGELEEDWVIFDDASKFKNITEEGAGFATINGSAAVLSDNLLEGEICGYDFGSYTLAFTEASDTTSAQMVLRNAVLS